MFIHFSGMLHLCILQVSGSGSVSTELSFVRFKGLDNVQDGVLISETFFVDMKNKPGKHWE